MAWMTEVPDYQAWMNVITSIPTYSTMGTSPAIASSPLITPRPLSKQYKMKRKTQWVSLLLLWNWPMNNSPLRPQQPTCPHLLPSQPPMFFPHATINVLHIELIKKLYLQIMSSPRLHDCPSQHPRVFQPRPTGWKPKRAAKRDRFQKRMHHYRDTNQTMHIGPPRTSRTSQQAFCTPWRPLAPTSNRSRISHSEPPQNSSCDHLGFAYLLPIILGASLLQSLGWLLDMVSKGQPSLMFLQHQVVARWVAWDQSFLSQAFMALPAVVSWILAAYLIGSLFRSLEQFSPSDAPDLHRLVSSSDTLDPSFPQHHRAPTRPPHFSATSAFTTPPRRFPRFLREVPHPLRSPRPSSSPIFFSPAHGGATIAAFIPATLSASLRTTPPPYRRPPRLPFPIVSFSGCPFLLLKSHLASFFGWLSRQVGLMGGGGPPLPPPSLHLLPLDVPTPLRVRGPPLINVFVATLSTLATVTILR